MEFRGDLGNRRGFPHSGGAYKKNHLGALPGRHNFYGLSKFQNHFLVNICQDIIKGHVRLIGLFNLANNLVGVLLAYLIVQHGIIKQLHKALQLAFAFLHHKLVFNLIRFLKLLFKKALKAVQFFLKGIALLVSFLSGRILFPGNFLSL